MWTRRGTLPSVPPGKRILDASDAIRRSRAWRIHCYLEELDFIFRLHAANYRDLKQFTAEAVANDDNAARPILELWYEKNRDRFDATLEEASRLLHNFLASATTLVDHTRNHIRELYSDSAFQIEYKRQLTERIAKNPVCRFVHGLRNYNLHYRFPVLRGVLKWERDGPLRSHLVMDLTTLRKWDKWDAAAQLYLTAADEELPVDRVADDYMTVVANFYQWLRTRQRQVQKPALERLRRKINLLVQLEAELFPQRHTNGSGSETGI